MVSSNEGHEWSAPMIGISNKNTWCPRCNLGYCLIEQAHEIAKLKGGKCLTENKDFKSGQHNLNWECEFGHVWLASLNAIKNKKTWCPKCNPSCKNTYEEVKTEIELRGWKLLSKEYKNQSTLLNIKCKNNHVFNQTFEKIKHRGYGCKYCNNKHISENICRLHFEAIFNKKFPTAHLKFMERLELDGYCAELGIAFEHHGEQHYSLKAFRGIHASKTELDLIALQKRDQRKIELCNKFGIKLIIIPSLFEKTKLKDLKTIIKEQCDNLNIEIGCDIFKINVPIEIAYNENIVTYDQLFEYYITQNKTRKEICDIFNLKPYQLDYIRLIFGISKINKKEKIAA